MDNVIDNEVLVCSHLILVPMKGKKRLCEKEIKGSNTRKGPTESIISGDEWL